MKLFGKLVLEFSPLGLFFLASTEYGFFTSTAVLMGATIISLMLTWHFFRQLALMAIITAITSLIAGAATLVLVDQMYIQLKPTIVGLIFSSILIVGLIKDKHLFKILLGENLYLTDEGWRLLTWLWLGYFLFITGLNEYIWRNHSFAFWAGFKAFGLMPLTVIYGIPQIYLLKKYSISAADTLSQLSPQKKREEISPSPQRGNRTASIRQPAE